MLRSLTVVASLLTFSIAALGQGKIAGQVTDASTGEALIGVNVLIDGTQQGTITNADGDYIILNVRPDEYTLVFSYIGYQTQRITGVRATTGQTTRYDVELSQEAIEGEEIVVIADRPLVQKDLTASKKTVNAEEIDALPVESFFGVLTTQAGVNTGPSGEIHIRGGRSNEVSYLVDGLSVGNPFETNGLATTLAADAIQEMTVISGAFNAEYGKAMSGIVNLVTKDGGDRIEGNVSVYGGDTFTQHDDIFFTPDNVRLSVYTLEGSLSGPVPGLSNLKFFLSGRRDVDDGYIFGNRLFAPGDSANFNVNPWYYEIQGRPWQEYDDRFTENPLPLPEDFVSMNPRESYNLLGKLSYRPTPGTKVEYSYLRDYTKRTPFSFGYRFNPDGVSTIRDGSQNHSLRWTHTLNDRTFYTVRASYAFNDFDSFLYDNPTDPRYVSTNRIIGFPGNQFLFGGVQRGQVFEDATSFRTKADITRQFGVTHEVKAGLEVQLHSLDRQNFTVLHDDVRYRQPTVEDVSSPSHDRYENQRVNEYSIYAQDKLEFNDFIINVGMRFERIEPNGQFVPDLLDPMGELSEAEPKNILMPRLGVSFPITERGIIHFSYGHFAQMPPLRNLYINPEFEFPANAIPTFGNVDMRPERTVQYEMGLQQQLGDQLAIDITGFVKDIRDYLALQRIRFSTIAGEDQFSIYRNKDYANVKGVTFALTKRRSRGGLLSATLDYTFQIAEGNRDDSDAFFFNSLSGRENELEVVPLDFDQRHILSSTVSLGRPGNWNVSFIGQYSTGYPYSPQIFDQNIDLLPNTGRKPSGVSLDAQLYKEFDFSGFQFRAFAKIFNLLDRLNEQFVFDDTGRASYTLDIQNSHATWRPFYNRPGVQTLETYNTRPHWYSAPREVRLGVSFAF